MKITAIEPIVLRAPTIDVSRADGTQDAFLVRVHTDEGLVGIGEADTAPMPAREIVTMPSSHSIGRGLAEILIGRDPSVPAGLWRQMYQASYHYGRSGLALHVISAIDMALWDLLGKVLDRPIAHLLGGEPKAVKVYASELMPWSVEEVRRVARRVLANGYTALKLGWGPLGRDIGFDEVLIRAAREALGPDCLLMLDGGTNYSVRSASNLAARVEDVQLYWFEEPLDADDFHGYRRLSDLVSIRTASGEAHSTLRGFIDLVEVGNVDVLQPDLGRCGGFTVAQQLSQYADAAGIEIVPHSFSTGVLMAASLQYVSGLKRPTLAEFTVTGTVLATGVIREEFEMRDGAVETPRGPGLGVSLDDDVVDNLRIA